LTDVANELRDKGALDEEECFIDATFVMAKGGGSEIKSATSCMTMICSVCSVVRVRPENGGR
jgi:hypothetical protein